MSSLQELLSREGFSNSNFSSIHKPSRPRGSRAITDDSITLPIYICHDKKFLDFSKKKIEKTFLRNGSSLYSSKRVGSVSESSKSEEPAAIDEVAIRAVVSILCGYVGRYVKDEIFREMVRKKCDSFLVSKSELDGGILNNLELGIKSVEKLVEESEGSENELRIKALRNSIGLLNMVVSLSSGKSMRKGETNYQLSACAQLYLAIVCKIERNDKVSAKHLLQVFSDSPFFARTHLLPDLWEHFFLPHLLHLKVWYSQELDVITNSEFEHKDRKIKALSKIYHEHMDKGTVQFALYYIQWLKDGAKAPTVPVVPSPSKSIYGASKKSSDSYFLHSSSNKNLYHAVFGPSLDQQFVELRHGNMAAATIRSSNERENLFAISKNYESGASAHDELKNRRMSSALDYRSQNTDSWHETVKSDYFRFLTCQNLSKEFVENSNVITKNSSVKMDGRNHLLSNDLSTAINTICSSDILSECEIAIRVVTKAWLDAHGDRAIEVALSKPPVVEGMLEVLLASSDDEILELVISVLAELVARNVVTRQIILNSDPQLQVFLRLLKSSSLFLKASILLYLSKPQAKQMISVEWLPLVLRVLEFGDQLQTLFSVRCNPHEAAFYLLDQLLKGFDEDRNLENCRHLIALGGLSLLLRRMERGEIKERKNSVLILSSCIQADGSCRNYLAENLNCASLLELIVHESNKNSDRCGLALLADLLCLSRRTRISRLLDDLKEGWNGLGIMNILLVYLQRAPLEEQPLVAAILLHLDFTEDPREGSVYREEAIAAIITALNCQISREEVQENLARALLMLGGHFSYDGEPSAENWLLQQAGFKESPGGSFHSKHVYDDFMQSYEEEEAMGNWQLKAATVFFNHGHKSLLSALSSSMINCIPCLAKASLITVSWMSSHLFVVRDENLRLMASSILAPLLIKYLNYDKDVEDRVLASYSLLNLSKYPECKRILQWFDDEVLDRLQNLSLVTWTAEELISIVRRRSMQQYTKLHNFHTQRSTRI